LWCNEIGKKCDVGNKTVGYKRTNMSFFRVRDETSAEFEVAVAVVAFDDLNHIGEQ
jgi:hypothetical protein